MTEVCIAGVGITKFGKFLDTPVRVHALDAAERAMADAGVEAGDIDLLVLGNAMSGLLTGQEMIRSEVIFGSTALGGLPMMNVENACGSGSSAVHAGWLAIKSGAYDVVLVVGAEKLTHPDKARTLYALSSGLDVERQPELEKELGRETSGGAFMMDIYADITQRYMAASGCTVDDLADVVVKNRAHAARNANAQFTTEVSRDEVLASRTISDPITLLMCSPIGDGAAALVLCSDRHARKNGGRPIRIRSSAIATAVPGGSPLTPGERASARAYEIAGIGPSEINLAEMHDASAPAELIHMEELGLCPKGEAPAWLRSGRTAIGGTLPINTSGGLLGRGHPVGATGCAQLVELTQQLRGQAGGRQVEGARIGIAENQGGYLHPDPAVAVVTILSRD